MALLILSQYCTLVILFEVELTIGDETFHETNYKNDEL
jgi:hypothetical protein